MRRLLYLAYFYPPLGGAGVQRSLKFTRYLPEFGWEPTVITGPDRYWIKDETLLREVDERVRVERAPQWGARFFGGGGGGGGGGSRSGGRVSFLRQASRWVFVPDAYVGWTLPAGRMAAREIESAIATEAPFDAIFTTSSPDSTHLIGRRMKQRFGLPWIADFRDPWTERLSYAPASPLHHRLHQHLESKVLTEADLVLVTSEETKTSFERLLTKRHGTTSAGSAAKIQVITNGYDEEDFAGVSAVTPSGDSIGPRANAPILHAGQLNPDRPIDSYLAGLALFLERNPGRANEARTLFLGAHYDRDREAVARFGLTDHVVFEGNCPHEESVAALCRAHVLLLLEQNTERGRLILPGKMFEYLRAGRPILGVVPPEGAAHRLIGQLGAGRVADPARPETVAESLEFLIDDRIDGKAFVPVDASPFERRALTKSLARSLDSLVPNTLD